MTTTQKVSVGDSVHLILDSKIEEEVLNFVKKQKIFIELFVCQNEKIRAELEIENEKIIVEGEVLQSAKNKPLTKNDFISNFKKSDLFDAEIKFVSFDDLFIPTKILNEFRRSVFEKVQNIVTKKRKRDLKKIKINKDLAVFSLSNFKIIESLDEKFDAENIIFSPEMYNLEEIAVFKEMCEKENKVPILDLPNFALKKDIELLKEIVQKLKIKVMINNYYALSVFDDYVIGAGMNVYNSVTANVLGEKFITAENEIGERVDYPYMTLRHCPMKSHLNASCDKCPYKDGFIYRMDNGRVLKLKRKKLSTCTFYLV